MFYRFIGSCMNLWQIEAYTYTYVHCIAWDLALCPLAPCVYSLECHVRDSAKSRRPSVAMTDIVQTLDLLTLGGQTQGPEWKIIKPLVKLHMWICTIGFPHKQLYAVNAQVPRMIYSQQHSLLCMHVFSISSCGKNETGLCLCSVVFQQCVVPSLAKDHYFYTGFPVVSGVLQAALLSAGSLASLQAVNFCSLQKASFFFALH